MAPGVSVTFPSLPRLAEWKESQIMPDGSKRKRRNSLDRTAAQRRWYAQHRARRFRARFAIDTPSI